MKKVIFSYYDRAFVWITCAVSKYSTSRGMTRLIWGNDVCWLDCWLGFSKCKRMSPVLHFEDTLWINDIIVPNKRFKQMYTYSILVFVTYTTTTQQDTLSIPWECLYFHSMSHVVLDHLTRKVVSLIIGCLDIYSTNRRICVRFVSSYIICKDPLLMQSW